MKIFLIVLFILTFVNKYPCLAAEIRIDDDRQKSGAVGVVYADFGSRDKFSNSDLMRLDEDIRKNDVTITVNGVPAEFEWNGNGISIKINSPGKKIIRIKTPSFSAEKNYIYAPKPFIDVVNLLDDEAVFDLPSHSIIKINPGFEIVGFDIKPGSVKISLNGREIKVQMKNLKCDSAFVSGMVSLSGGADGRQELAIAYEDSKGNTLSYKKMFYYFRPYYVPAGIEFWYRVAPIGTKSGPFYSLEASNGSMRVDKNEYQYKSVGYYDNEIYYPNVNIEYQKIKTIRPGDCSITVKRVNHFMIKISEKVYTIFFKVFDPKKTDK